jgi:hypothetical protein
MNNKLFNQTMSEVTPCSGYQDGQAIRAAINLTGTITPQQRGAARNHKFPR